MSTPLVAFGGSDRWSFAWLVAASLVALGGCSKPDEGKGPSDPKEAVAHASGAHAAIASSETPQGGHEGHARGMPEDGHPDGMPAGAGTSGQQGMQGGSMGVMGRMGQAPGVGGQAGLPAAPGAPHLYHIGAEGFFLEQGSAIGLTAAQQGSLSAIKEKAALAYSATERSIHLEEMSLWTLTAVETPDAAKIDEKVSEIARLGAQQRMDFIRAVGAAVAVLDDAQRKAVVASSSSATSGAQPTPPAMAPAAAPMPAGGAMPAGAAAPPMKGMGDM